MTDKLSRAATTQAGDAYKEFYEEVKVCMDDTWECERCGNSEPWWTKSNADYGTRKAVAKIEAAPPSQPVAPVVPDGPYKIEPHGDVWVLYSGRSSMFHGWNLARISEPSVGILELIEKALNAFAAPAQPQPSAQQFNEAEFNELVKKGTEAWEGVPDDFVESLRGAEQEPTAADWRRAIDESSWEFETDGDCDWIEQRAREIARERKA